MGETHAFRASDGLNPARGAAFLIRKSQHPVTGVTVRLLPLCEAVAGVMVLLVVAGMGDGWSSDRRPRIAGVYIRCEVHKMRKILAETVKGQKSSEMKKRASRTRRKLRAQRSRDLQLKNYLLESHPELGV